MTLLLHLVKELLLIWAQPSVFCLKLQEKARVRSTPDRPDKVCHTRENVTAHLGYTLSSQERRRSQRQEGRCWSSAERTPMRLSFAAVFGEHYSPLGT